MRNEEMGKVGSLKVLIVLPNLRVSNGVANFIMNYYRRLQHDEVQVDFATLSYRESPYLEEVNELGSKVFVLPSLFRHPIRHIKKCREILQNNTYSIIHNNTLLQSLPIMWLSRKRVRARILHSHNPKMGETRLKEVINSLCLPLLLKYANHYAACSESAGKAMFGDNDFDIIPNVIDVNAFLFDEKKRSQMRDLENANEKKIIGSVGRLAEQKNPFFAVDVIGKVIKLRPDVQYWWIGSGPLDKEVKKYVESKHLAGKIKLMGSRTDMSELYQAMDIFFLPSKFEGFGIACIEAEAAGLTCVVSDQFPSEVNITGNVYFGSLNQSTDEWADLLINSIEKCPNRIEGNRSCRKSIFSIEKSGETLLNVYKKCLEH